MIRMIQSMSAANSKAYFNDSLTKAEYYSEKQELAGTFCGKLAARLGLGREVTKRDFFALCENVNLKTGSSITPKVKEKRTSAYDINFHVPKSVSIVDFLSNDPRIMDVFQDSVDKTMAEIEADSRVRVRKDGQDFDKQSGELAWATFVHKTSRPVQGKDPDPHLHAHCVVFNMTHDAEENREKACQFREIKRNMPYYQALYHKHLSDALMGLGYQVRRTKTAFEIENIPQAAIDLFSKREDEIGRVAKKKGITDAKELSELGVKTRARKNKDMSMSELKASWRRQIIENKLDQINPDAIVKKAHKPLGRFVSANQSIQHALQHSFARASVVPSKTVLTSAFRHSIGTPEVSPDMLKAEFEKDVNLIRVEDETQEMCTTQSVLKEERAMVNLAKDGIATMKPLYAKCPSLNLEGQQRQAVEHILTTSDQLTIVQGAAGSGKTTLMTEAVNKIRAAHKEVFLVAPSSEASRDVLRSNGFANAETVAMFLTDTRFQDRIANGVLWVDEAGLLGVADTKRLLEITKDKGARLILGGDTKQHTSVVRGDALRILRKYGGVKSAEVNKIYRQQQKEYRGAIEKLATGDAKNGFKMLDEIGYIKEVGEDQPNKELVADYVQSIKAKRSSLVICPTHEFGRQVTDDIRAALKQEKLLDDQDFNITRYVSLNFTEAEKKDIQSYEVGHWVRFSQNAKGIKRGSEWQIVRNWGGGVSLKDVYGKTAELPIHQPTRYDIMQKTTIPVAKGDKLRITQNSFDVNDKRMDNGTLLQVTKISRNGNVQLQNTTSKCKYSLKRDFGHIAHAHCVTSHASQGKTVDDVFVALPSAALPGVNLKQFYVSASRGKHNAKIYTEDKEELLRYATREADRQSAIEFVTAMPSDHNEYVKMHRHAEYEKKNRVHNKDQRDISKKVDHDAKL